MTSQSDASWLSLVLTDVRKNYGARRVLGNVTREVSGGVCVAVVGPNGSGKSTLLKIVAGLLRPTRGTIAIQSGGKTITNAIERRRYIGYAAPDLSFYPELTGLENLMFFSQVSGERASEAEITARLTAVGLTGRGKDTVAVYSSGMRQRLRLAYAVRGGDVPILLLDEPSLALDAGGVTLVGEIIAAQKARGGIVLLATNDEREAILGDERLDIASVA